MAQYTVLRPIEYNNKLYVPASSDAPQTARSAGNGKDIPLNAGGLIELPENVADQFTLGQVAEYSQAHSKLKSSGSPPAAQQAGSGKVGLKK